ncbi:MAG: LysR family transcriptional regulator [Planctomycetes bacterium]|nr:LysR family transcriptional regulator [Planctomycetota bacterium]
MHLKSLKVFCDVANRRSFSRAAAGNGLSQSAASQVVHQLEARLGVKLIDRSKRPLVLTAEGDVFYEGCRAIVQRYVALEEQVRMLRQEVAGRVRVASIYSIGLSHMNDFIQYFMGLYPKANIRLDYEHPARVYELVEGDQIELGLVSFPKGSRNIVALAWREEPMVFVCSPQHPLAQPGPIRLEELHGASMVAFDAGLKIRRVVDRALARHHAETQVVMAFDNIETLKRAIEINAGVSLLPEPTVVREVQLGSLVVRPLANETLVRPIGIVYRRGKELGTAARRFMQLLREYPASPSGPAASASVTAAAPAPPLAVSGGAE